MTIPRPDDFVGFGSAPWWVFLGVVGLARGADLFSTWLATPGLELEANPLARWLGWRRGIVLNVAMSIGCAFWPMLALSLSVTSVLVAARNLQQAWLMRSLGETGYRLWFADRIAACPPRLVWACFLGEGALTAGVGATLLSFSPFSLVPYGVGLGILAYGVAIAVFTGMSLWRFFRVPSHHR